MVLSLIIAAGIVISGFAVTWLGVELTFCPPQSAAAIKKVRITLGVSFLILLAFTLWATMRGERAMADLPKQIANLKGTNSLGSSQSVPQAKEGNDGKLNIAPRVPATKPSFGESRNRDVNAEQLGKQLLRFKGVTVAVWNDGTNEPGALAKQIEIGLGMAHATLQGGGQKMADAPWFPDSLTIEISAKPEPPQEQAHKAATELHDVLKNSFHINSQVRYTEQEFPENFMRIKVAGR